jgi:curli biogenesis system outer membrane secretion channel CsgG
MRGSRARTSICAVLAVATGALAACGDSITPSVARYCEYGAVNQAQLDGCESHVSVGDFEKSDTNAALYAKYLLTFCRADAGPFCEETPPPND